LCGRGKLVTGYEADFYREIGVIRKTLVGVHEELKRANELKKLEIEYAVGVWPGGDPQTRDAKIARLKQI
jgi:hypothetical protein